jgi:hypothetical protein
MAISCSAGETPHNQQYDYSMLDDFQTDQDWTLKNLRANNYFQGDHRGDVEIFRPPFQPPISQPGLIEEYNRAKYLACPF